MSFQRRFLQGVTFLTDTCVIPLPAGEGRGEGALLGLCVLEFSRPLTLPLPRGEGEIAPRLSPPFVSYEDVRVKSGISKLLRPDIRVN
jgi:hypothetical protein